MFSRNLTNVVNALKNNVCSFSLQQNTVNSEIFVRVLFPRNHANAYFREINPRESLCKNKTYRSRGRKISQEISTRS